MKLFFCPRPATALVVCCALVAIASAQPETPMPTTMDTTVTDGTTATMETPAPTTMDDTMTATMETPAPTMHDDMDHEETMGPTATVEPESDGAAAIGGGARMIAVVSCALAAGAALGL
ncbi:unnamed protein product [Ectocarpus sp. 4 AP-2014]